MRTFLLFLILVTATALSVFAQNDIRSVDFRNFSYEINSLSGEGKEKVTVKDGTYSRNEEEDKLYFTITNVAFGDLDGDGREESAVTYLFNTGGTGNFTGGVIFSIKNAKPTVLTYFEGGDRAYGGIRDVLIRKLELIVGRYSPGPNGGACCPEFVETSRYKFVDGSLHEVGKKLRRELYPLQRVSFKKKSTFDIIPVKLEKFDRKRFVVSARKGQKLYVSSGFEPAASLSYALTSGNGTEEKTPNGIIVKLNENGDFVFDVSNTTDTDLEFSITVEIN